MLISPTEPELFRVLGKVSSLPEQRGADFLWVANGHWCGVQRKEVKDLIASLEDGRLSKEVGQMVRLDRKMLIVEGRPRWTNDGHLVDRHHGRWTRKMLRGALWSIREQGVWLDYSDNMQDTVQVLAAWEAWTRKVKHHAGGARPGPTSPWGRADNRQWCEWLLQGFEGVGPELAARIIDTLGVPLLWKVTEKDLMRVEGIGKVKAQKLIRALEDKGQGNDRGAA